MEAEDGLNDSYVLFSKDFGLSFSFMKAISARICLSQSLHCHFLLYSVIQPPEVIQKYSRVQTFIRIKYKRDVCA